MPSQERTAPSEPSDVSSLSYEAARDELVRVVTELEQGSATLERSLGLWERGEALAARCEEWLVGARARLDAARSRSDGSASDDSAPGGTASGDTASGGTASGAMSDEGDVVR